MKTYQLHLNILALCFLSSIFRIDAIFFHVGETESKCFLEEIPDDTLVAGHYKVQSFNKRNKSFETTSNGMGMHVEVKDSMGKTILARTYSAEGRFTFTSHTSGQHSICLQSNSSAWLWGGELRVHLDLQKGTQAQDYKKIASAEQMTDLQLRIRILVDQVDQITKEQTYQREREGWFRSTSESTAHRVLWWSILQVLIFFCVALWQVTHLKSFFQAKKLV